MWDLIVSVPDHCLSFYFVRFALWVLNYLFLFCFVNMFFYSPGVLEMIGRVTVNITFFSLEQ